MVGVTPVQAVVPGFAHTLTDPVHDAPFESVAVNLTRYVRPATVADLAFRHSPASCTCPAVELIDASGHAQVPVMLVSFALVTSFCRMLVTFRVTVSPSGSVTPLIDTVVSLWSCDAPSSSVERGAANAVVSVS